MEKGKRTKQGPSGAHETRFGDDKPEDLEEANPFSFKEFLKTKNLSLSKEDTSTNSRIYPKEASRHPLGLDHSSPTSQTTGHGLDYQQPFFEDPTGAGDLEEEDGWDGAYVPSTVGQTHCSRVTGSTSPCGTYLSFFSNSSELAGPGSLPPWTISDSDSHVSRHLQRESTCRLHSAGRVLGRRHLRALQVSDKALKDGNSKLRGKLNEVQSFSETQTEMVRTLEWKLEAKMMKEEGDLHDLESVVQVEQNLKIMTKQAIKAENHLVKLKQEVSLLQAQGSSFKREDEVWHTGQGTSLTVVKQSSEVAWQNLRIVMNSAHSSKEQLSLGAETLNLVAEILKSIDRISEVNGEENS